MERRATLSLTESVRFKAVLQKGKRVQVPKLIRWYYKMELNQVLKVKVKTEAYREEKFVTHMSRDGRLITPKLILKLLTRRRGKPHELRSRSHY